MSNSNNNTHKNKNPHEKIFTICKYLIIWLGIKEKSDDDDNKSAVDMCVMHKNYAHLYLWLGYDTVQKGKKKRKSKTKQY